MPTTKTKKEMLEDLKRDITSTVNLYIPIRNKSNEADSIIEKEIQRRREGFKDTAVNLGNILNHKYKLRELVDGEIADFIENEIDNYFGKGKMKITHVTTGRIPRVTGDIQVTCILKSKNAKGILCQGYHLAYGYVINDPIRSEFGEALVKAKGDLFVRLA